MADTGDLDYDTNGSWMGKLWAGYQDYFYGSIDDVMVYNRALTDPEISTIYNWHE